MYFTETMRDSDKWSHTKHFTVEWFKIASNIRKTRKEKKKKEKLNVQE